MNNYIIFVVLLNLLSTSWLSPLQTLIRALLAETQAYLSSSLSWDKFPKIDQIDTYSRVVKSYRKALTIIDNNAKLAFLLVDFLNRKAGIRSAFHTWWLQETTNHTQMCIQSVKTLLGQYNLAFQPEKGSDIMFNDIDVPNLFRVMM